MRSGASPGRPVVVVRSPALGVDGFSEDSRFAHVEGHRLSNHIVDDYVPDLQDMGYGESWIVERWPDEADR